MRKTGDLHVHLRSAACHVVLAGFVLAGLLLVGGSRKTLAADRNDPVVATTEDLANVRRGPSTEDPIIGTIYHNGIGSFLKESEDGAWYRIRSGSVTGYVSADLLAVGEAAEALMDQAGYYSGRVITGDAPVYMEADDQADVAEILPVSSYVEIRDGEAVVLDGADWIPVKTPYQNEGWMRSEDLDLQVSYSTAESVIAAEKRMAQQEDANDSAFEESALWEEAQEALAAMNEAKMVLLEAEITADGGWVEDDEWILDLGDETGSGSVIPADADEAREEADRLEKAAEEKVERAQKASVKAQAAEKVAIEAARLAPRGAPGCDFVTLRDHTLLLDVSVGQELVNYACQFVGNPYVWGGESLTKGCDCSGFTMQVYARYGVELPHFAQSQAAYGELVDEEDLQPGDLVFYQDSTGYIGHVAIYIGNHTIVHAANRVSGICFSDIHYSSRRILCRHLLD